MRILYLLSFSTNPWLGFSIVFLRKRFVMRKLMLRISLSLLLINVGFLSLLANSSISGLTNTSSIEAQNWVDSVMNSLTLREKIAQLFMVAAYSNKDQNHIDEIKQLVSEEKIGGLCFFQGGPVRQANLTNLYQGLADIPLLISMDAEWGLGMRLDSTLSYPRQMTLGAIEDPRIVYQMGADIANQLKRLGVHINFAPVVDVNNNPDNPVINTRSFGEDMEAVSQKGLAYMLGLQDNGVLACAKHFPGHGDTNTDSHYDLPLLNHSSSRIDSLELYPFRWLIQNGVASIMVGHMEIPALEAEEKVPSSLSKTIVSSMLINDLGFNGLVITDALNMKGVSKFFKPVDVNYMALQAGNDIVLFPSDVKESISRVEREVEKGKFPIEEIEKKCRKVLEAKYAVGLSEYDPISTKDLVSDLNTSSSKYLIRQIAEQAITILNNTDSIIPIKNLGNTNIAYIEIGDGFGTPFREQMEMYAPLTTFPVYPDASNEELSDLLSTLNYYDLIVVGFHAITSSPAKNFGVTPEMATFLFNLSTTKKTILNIFGSPYSLGKLFNLNSFNGLVVAYDNSETTQNLAAQLLFGGMVSTGKLPVTISDTYQIGSGIDTGSRIRLRYSVPDELGIDASILSKVDSIAKDAIEREATPGMQILAAKDGVVFYNKSFGGHTYNDKDLAVDHLSIYDIASVTKIAATLPAIMDMYSKGKLLLNDTLGQYLDLPDTSKFNGLVISDVLLHQAGLVPWIPFYQRTMTSLWRTQPVVNGKFSESFPYKLGPERYMNRHSNPSRKFYRNEYSRDFPYEVANGMYSGRWINDSITNWIIESRIGKAGKYNYSDLGFILLQQAISNSLNEPYDDYLQNRFYKNLGMNNTLFNPLKEFEQERIVPTENDLIFRKQLIWGHVHDPAAAMMGGVAGHAGLFSTANDMAKLLQMYLNGGVYGGVRYFPTETIEYFTSCINCVNGIRRGLGFDKPEPDPNKPSPVSRRATSFSFGHSGFTGVLVWVDPAYNLVYVFISNRVFPDAENKVLTNMDIRTKVQDVIYQAIEGDNQ